jgi:hypothetical protein
MEHVGASNFMDILLHQDMDYNREFALGKVFALQNI